MPRIRRKGKGEAEVSHTATYTDQAGKTQTRTLTAAVRVMSGPRIDRSTTRRRPAGSVAHAWQSEAWAMYDCVGEFRFGINWLARAASQVRLVAARVDAPGEDPTPVDTGLAADLVNDFSGGRPGQAAFIHRAAQQLKAAGDTYFVATPDPDANPEDDTAASLWRAYSCEEVSTGAGGVWQVDDGYGRVSLPDDALVIRCWEPHPRCWAEADSAARASLPVLRELHTLTMRVMAELESRLAGSGILFLPEEMTLLTGQAEAGDDSDGADEDPFLAVLHDAMVTPIKDRGSASSVVPIVVTGPGEFCDKATLIKFWSDLDASSKELRDESLRRLALGLDTPSEVILGMGDSNHWSAWQISEETVRLVVEPLIAVICLALTVGWLRPALAAAGESDPSAWCVWFDSSPLRVRPDKSADAILLYDRFELSGDALRRETGFDEADKPGDDELVRMLLLALAKQTTDPAALLRALGVPDNLLPEVTAPDPVPPAVEAAPVEEDPRNLPEQGTPAPVPAS